MLETMPASELAAAVRREHAWALATVPHVLASLLSYLLEQGRRTWGDDGLAQRLERAATVSWPRRWWLFGPLRRRLGCRMVAVVSGGASLDAEVERLWRLLGYAVIQGYGLTEAAPLVALSHPFRARPGAVGKPLAGIEVRLAGDGEILVRGRNVASVSGPVTYIDDDGWLHTGDLGVVLDDGSISFRGRIADRIVTPAGVNVDLQDVAAVLRAVDGVIDATATELPWGEPGTVCAVLVVVPGADVEAAVHQANRRLADAAHVRSWFIWPLGDLPRTPTGKIRRGAVMQWLERQSPAAAGGDRAAPTPVDEPVNGVDRVLQAIVTSGAGAAPGMANVPVAELLSSLDRVELAARLEELYGGAAGDAVFTDAQTVGGLVAAVPRSQKPGDRSRARLRRRTQPPDPATWRFWWPARASRLVLRELVMHPLARALVRLEVESALPLNGLHGPALLASNHTSYLDPIVQFVLPARLRGRLAPAARWNFFAEHAHGGLLYFCAVLGLNVFPLVQDGDWRPTLRIAGDLADRGHSILIFPEGTLSRDGELHAFQRGVAVMSRELHVPVVPCAVAGLERVLPPGSGRPRLLRRSRARVAFCVGTPLPALRPGDDVGATIEALETAVRELRRRARSLGQQ
jgi:long-chain acyl-CoA synthetase